jgi:hypothetical protein
MRSSIVHSSDTYCSDCAQWIKFSAMDYKLRHIISHYESWWKHMIVLMLPWTINLFPWNTIYTRCSSFLWWLKVIELKAKAVQLYATKALGWRAEMGVSGQRHLPATEPVWTQRLEEKSIRLCQGSNLNVPVVQPVARHYADWANRPSYWACK